ncbi:MAG: O-phospho-L-seryl-tRNA:Cys-tRNA synthase [Candidatus Hadarchaeales archaeon]
MPELEKYTGLTREWTKYINLNPIQRGGILSPEARRVLSEFGDGYSVCDWCRGRLDEISKPPVSDFYQDLADFLGMDVARVVTRCREAKFIVFSTLAKPGQTVVVDSLAHYSSFLAAELAGLRIKEVPNTGYPEFKISPEEYERKIEEVKKETGEPPALALLTHADPHYGNLSDAKEIGKICHEKGVPFMLNAAYTAGVMPVNGRELGVDLLVSSGHKSWAASAPTGILAMRKEFADKVLRRSELFPQKELALLGCTVMGAPLLSLMASFPSVLERVKRWEEEVEKTRFLVRELEEIKGTKQLGTRPKQHHLIHFESTGLAEVSKKHKRKGFFLYEELKERGIVGIIPGRSEHFELSVYGLEWERVKYVADAFKEIARKYDLL